MSDLLRTALKYHAKGLAVVPIGNGSKSPIVKEWETKRLTEADLTFWFSNGHNPSGLGIITGQLSGNLAILDFDGLNWNTAFGVFCDFWEDLCCAPIVETGSGKRHLWVKIPDLPPTFTNRKFKHEIIGYDDKGKPIYAQIVELRGNESNNLAPPSLHPSGGKYRWLTDKAELPEVSFNELYQWLDNWAEKPKAKVTTDPQPDNGEYAPLPRRTLEFMALGANEGDRNDELYEASKQYCASGRPIEKAIEDLKPVALRIGLEEREIEATIKSGYKAATEKGFTPITTGGKPTHDVLRDRWLSRAEQIIYGLGEFRRYQAGLWPAVSEWVIKRELLEVIEAAKPEGIKPSQGIVSSVIELARIKIAVEDDSIFDAQPDYLVCGNGTLHIPTLTLGPHDPHLFATSGVSFDYDPSAKAPAWTAFLFDLGVSTSQDVVDFLQEIAGYALTTDTRYEISPWLYGPPGSGKSTLLTGFEAMLGSRCGLLGLADIERNRFALAALPGKTLAIATEQPGDFIASTHVLNAIISGETITVDRKFKEAITVTPRCKLAWAMNELPRVSDPNSGLFRRVKVVTFPVIPESERDPALKEAIKTEGAGILNWALKGLGRLRNRGRFEIPQEVKDATQSFKDTNDIPGRFVEECCVTGNDENSEPYRAQASQLYNAYKAWCIENGHKPQSSTSLAEDWKRLKFEKRRPGGINHWFNVGLRNV